MKEMSQKKSTNISGISLQHEDKKMLSEFDLKIWSRSQQNIYTKIYTEEFLYAKTQFSRPDSTKEEKEERKAMKETKDDFPPIQLSLPHEFGPDLKEFCGSVNQSWIPTNVTDSSDAKTKRAREKTNRTKKNRTEENLTETDEEMKNS